MNKAELIASQKRKFTELSDEELYAHMNASNPKEDRYIAASQVLEERKENQKNDQHQSAFLISKQSQRIALLSLTVALILLLMRVLEKYGIL